MHYLISTLAIRISPLLTITTLTLLVFLGCKKDKEREVMLPPVGVETSSLAFITPISAELTGKLINEGDQEIIDHGFVYSFGSDVNFTKISLGADVTSGFFTVTLNDLKFSVIKGIPIPLVVKAYVIDKNGIRYGEVHSGFYKGTFVTGMDPLEGKVGDVVTINGRYKGLKPNDIKVVFGGIEAKIKTLTENVITVDVPKDIPVGHGEAVSVVVQIGVASDGPLGSFIIWANIKDFNPKSGPVGTKITFTADNLPKNEKSMIMYFDDDAAFNYYDSEYFIRVPSAVQKEKTKLYYSKRHERIALPGEFIVTPPIIRSITPNPALDHQEMTIHLDNIEQHMGGNEPLVKIGFLSQYIFPNKNGDLVFKLEGEPIVGKSYPVTLIYGPHTITYPIPLTIIAPKATDFSPKKGFPGTVVHIKGKFAKGADYWVNFGKLSASGNAISDTEIITHVPFGIENKTYELSLLQQAGNVKLPGVFEGQSTRFDAVLPASGPVGTKMTITGEGIYGNPIIGYMLNLGGSIAYSSENTLNKIVITVPDHTPPGMYPIKLADGNYVIDTGLSFTVTK